MNKCQSKYYNILLKKTKNNRKIKNKKTGVRKNNKTIKKTQRGGSENIAYTNIISQPQPQQQPQPQPQPQQPEKLTLGKRLRNGFSNLFNIIKRNISEKISNNQQKGGKKIKKTIKKK